MSEAIEAAVERLQTLIAYSRETGTRTGYVQGKILREFSAKDQEKIIRLVSSSLAGGSPDDGEELRKVQQ